MTVADIDVHGLGLTDLIILVGIVIVAIREVADFRGWSRSSKILRRENEDLIRRNRELEHTVVRLEKTIAELQARLADHERLIADMKLRDVTAVFDLMVGHEKSAAVRAKETQRILAEIRDTLKEAA